MQLSHAFIATAIVFLGSASAFASEPTAPPKTSDILWRIVSNCLDPAPSSICADNACPSPQAQSACATHDCRTTTVVWEQSPDSVAISDRKMCGCPGDFIHGLAMPRTKVSGVEDPRRFDSAPHLWEFAWNLAALKMPAESAAVVVNPPAERSQNQLHLHIVSLKIGGRDALLRSTPPPLHVADLENVWRDAQSVWDEYRRSAPSAAVPPWYGIAVAKDCNPQTKRCDGFLVAATAHSPEALFTRYACDLPANP